MSTWKVDCFFKMKAAIVKPKMKNIAASEMQASMATIRKQNNQPAMSKGSRKQKPSSCRRLIIVECHKQ